MSLPFTRLAAGMVLGLAALAMVPVARAAIVTYTFEVTNFGLGSQAGNTLAGSFSFDDAQVPSPGLFGEDLYTLDSFSFTFNNVPYSEADLTAGSAVFVAGQFMGLDAAVGTLFQFLPGDGVFTPSFAYSLSDTDSGQADVTYAAAAVPEPATGALLALALAGAGAGRRLRARR